MIKQKICLGDFSQKQQKQRVRLLHSSHTRLLPLLIVSILLTFICNISITSATTDWMQNCSVCHCNWNSGKKTADCKSKRLTKIPDDLSNEMQVVDFSRNQIPELRREEFQTTGLLNLHKIYMRNCTIMEVNREAFKGLSILIELDMSNNQIKVLHAGTFRGLDKLRNVLMNNNEIEILENQLFVDLPYLSRVEFKGNRLKEVQLHAFGQLNILQSISLEFNKLTHLRKETFMRLPKLVHLSLSENAWNCTCELQEFRDFAISKNLYTQPTSCHEPPQLRDKLWIEVPSENFACRPRILGRVRSFVEAQSDNITLPCRIVGTPRPNVTWIYNKRLLNLHDQRIRVHNTLEQQADDNTESQQVMTSELRIYGVRTSDKGAYTCVADNRGGKAEAEFQLLVNGDFMATAGGGVGGNIDGTSAGLGMGSAIGASTTDTYTNLLLKVCLIVMSLLLLLIIGVLVIFWHCRRIKTYQKDSTMMSENGLIPTKLDKAHNSSMLEGSVIMEMQKSLLTEVNPVEKPPRRTDIESVDGGEDGHEIKKTLLDETALSNHSRDDETHSVALSDATPRSRHTFVDDTYGTTLPPDLLAFPARVPPTSPSMQSSQSNIPDQIIYGIRSPPLTSPVYAHMTPHGIYGTTTIAAATPNGFMTLQHPKSRNLALIATAAANSRSQQQQLHAAQQLHHSQLAALQHQEQLAAHNQQLQQQSPFLPAPIVYSPATAIVMKQGYMTIPRKPRVPSWAPSTSGGSAVGPTTVSAVAHLSEFQSPTSPNPSETGTATTAELQPEPVYDNLGLRTTAGGNSTLNLHKPQSLAAVNNAANNSYTMRDRPLPATPSLTSVASNVAMAMPTPQQQQQQQQHHQQHQQQQQQMLAPTTSKIYEPIHELLNQQLQCNSELEPLYGTSQRQHPAMHHGITIVPAGSISGAASPTPSVATTATTVPASSPSTSSTTATGAAATTTTTATGGGAAAGDGSPKIAKIPPRPPPKPKKKMSVTATRSGQGSTSQLFDDEGEDGTEV